MSTPHFAPESRPIDPLTAPIGDVEALLRSYRADERGVPPQRSADWAIPVPVPEGRVDSDTAARILASLGDSGLRTSVAAGTTPAGPRLTGQAAADSLAKTQLTMRFDVGAATESGLPVRDRGVNYRGLAKGQPGAGGPGPESANPGTATTITDIGSILRHRRDRAKGGSGLAMLLAGRSHQPGEQVVRTVPETTIGQPNAAGDRPPTPPPPNSQTPVTPRGHTSTPVRQNQQHRGPVSHRPRSGLGGLWARVFRKSR